MVILWLGSSGQYLRNFPYLCVINGKAFIPSTPIPVFDIQWMDRSDQHDPAKQPHTLALERRQPSAFARRDMAKDELADPVEPVSERGERQR